MATRGPFNVGQPDLVARIPVMIGPFSSIPGQLRKQPSRLRPNGATGPPTAGPPSQHFGQTYPRVIVDELMPVLLRLHISKDPERHGIGGASSGAIAAFSHVAWERPRFRKG